MKQLADNSITVWRNEENAGDRVIRNLKLRDGLGRRLEIDIAGTEALIDVTMVRHDQATTGISILQFEAGRLTYKPRPPDAQEPKEPEQQEIGLKTDDPFPDVR